MEVSQNYPYPGIVPRTYSTNTNSRYGYYHGFGSVRALQNTTFLPTEVPGSLSEIAQVPGRYSILRTNVVPVPIPAPRYLKGHTLTPGVCATDVQNLRKFRLRILPRVWFCTYPAEHNFFTFRNSVPGTGEVWKSSGTHKFSGTGMHVLQNSHKFRVGAVYECCTRTRTYTRTRVFKRAYPYPG